MPAVYFLVRWPDQTTTNCYSPSTVIHTYFKQGDKYKKGEFLSQARSGLNAASEKVRAKFGFACSSAMDQLHAIENISEKFADDSVIEIIAVD
jgi:uncharacterized repeat protein (TIGR04042 family)